MIKNKAVLDAGIIASAQAVEHCQSSIAKK